MSLRSIACLIVFAGTTVAQFSFAPSTALPAAQEPEGVVIADFNGDARADLAVAVDTQDRVLVFFNGGAGQLTLGATVLLGFNAGAAGLAAGDFDADGDQDLAVTLHNQNQVRILNNLGGTFVAGASISVGVDPRGLIAVDLEGDLDVDLVTSNRSGNTVSVLRNGGGGVFAAATTITVGQEPRDVAAADFDRDGDLDLAVSDHDSRDIAILTQNAGTFGAPQFLSVGFQLRPEGLTAADLDGDGNADVAVATSGNGLNFVSVFMNQGGVLSGPVNFPAGGQDPADVVAADFDSDGDLDIACANTDSHTVTLLANGGAATFSAPQVLAAGTEPERLAVGDLTGNGVPDLAVSNKLSSDVRVFLNQAGPPAGGASVTQVTPPTIGTFSSLALSSPGDGGRAYQFALSGGTSPGILLSDGRTVPLNDDWIFQLTTSLGNPFVANGIGALSALGTANVGLAIPNQLSLIGTSVFAGFVVFDATASAGVRTISPALQVTFN